MSIDPTQNGPIQLSVDKTITEEGAKNISEALTPFAKDFKVAKDLSKLSDTKIRTVKSLDFSNAKKFFSSLAQAIRDICHNIDAFLSTPDQNLRIYNISSQTSNLLKTLKEHEDDIKKLRNGGDKNNIKGLKDAAEMLKQRLDQLNEKMAKIGSDFDILFGEGKAALEMVRDQIKDAIDILEPGKLDKLCGDVRHAGNKLKKFVNKSAEHLSKSAEHLSDEIERKINKVGQKISNISNRMSAKMKQFINKK